MFRLRLTCPCGTKVLICLNDTPLTSTIFEYLENFGNVHAACRAAAAKSLLPSLDEVLGPKPYDPKAEKERIRKVADRLIGEIERDES